MIHLYKQPHPLESITLPTMKYMLHLVDCQPHLVAKLLVFASLPGSFIFTQRRGPFFVNQKGDKNFFFS